MSNRPVLPETAKIVELLTSIVGQPTGAVTWDLDQQPSRKQKEQKAPEQGDAVRRETKITGQTFSQSVKSFFAKVPWAGKPNMVSAGTTNPTSPVSVPITAAGERVPMGISAKDFFSRVPWHGDGEFDISEPEVPVGAGVTASQPSTQASAPANSSSKKHDTEELSAENLFSEFNV